DPEEDHEGQDGQRQRAGFPDGGGRRACPGENARCCGESLSVVAAGGSGGDGYGFRDRLCGGDDPVWRYEENVGRGDGKFYPADPGKSGSDPERHTLSSACDGAGCGEGPGECTGDD